MPSVLLLGGHGKIALHLTPLLLRAGHTVFSIVRNPQHVPEIASLSTPSTTHLLKPLVASIEDATDTTIQNLMTNIDWVVWSAGAGGKGGPDRTRAVDRDAAIRFIRGAIDAPSVKKFLMISATGARSPASWWNDEDLEAYRRSWSAMGLYYECKVAADEYLYSESRKVTKEGWEDICLRPGTLLDNPSTGKVDLGRTHLGRRVTREDVAIVAAELLERGGAAGLWLDLLNGEIPVKTAVEQCLKEQVTARE